jgi:predicted Zn-dependent protease
MIRNKNFNLFRSFIILGEMLFITGCGVLSPDQESRLGEEQVAEIARTSTLVSDTNVLEYIEHLTNNLLEVSPSTTQGITFRIIDSDAFSAFAIPGGNVYLTKGTIMACRNVSELASILAHEIAHVKAGHISANYRRFQTSNRIAELAGITLAVATGNPFVAGAGDLTANMGSSAFIGAHSRESEREADELAFRMMQNAGYDPRSQITIFMRLAAYSNGQSTLLPLLLTHPLPDERVNEAINRSQSLSETQRFTVNDEGKLESIQGVL